MLVQFDKLLIWPLDCCARGCEGGQFKVESIMPANLLLCLIHQVCQVAAMTSPFLLLRGATLPRHDVLFALPGSAF